MELEPYKKIFEGIVNENGELIGLRITEVMTKAEAAKRYPQVGFSDSPEK